MKTLWQFGAGVPHPRSYGTNARVLARFVREQGTISLEEAIRKMTSLLAPTFPLRDRGLVREAYTEGFDAVLVNGAVVFDQGVLKKEKPAGRVLRLSGG